MKRQQSVLKQGNQTIKQQLQRYTKYNVCFSYEKKKKDKSKEQFRLSPLFHSSRQSLMNKTNKSIQQKNKDIKRGMQKSQSDCFQQKRINRIQCPEDFSSKQEMNYIKCGFPQRKKKNGEQQLLKLLIKFSQTFHNDSKQKSGKPNKIIQNQKKNIEKHRFKPKVKLNWIKQRYCLYRAKEVLLFPEQQKQSFSKQQDKPQQLYASVRNEKRKF